MSLTCSWIRPPDGSFPEFGKLPHSIFDKTVVQPPRMALFRRKFFFEEEPEGLVAFFSGDPKFRLFVNGRFVDDGPVEVGGDYAKTAAPDWWFVSRRDLTPFLRKGCNVIVAELLNTLEAQTDYSSGHAGFSFELKRNGETILHTDSAWRVSLNPAYCGPSLYRAELENGNCHAPDFDDSMWAFAEPVPSALAADWKLKKLDLPPLEEKTVFPEATVIPFEESARFIENKDLLSGKASFWEVKPGPPVVFYLRFPTELAGHLEFDVEASAGSELRFEFQEHPGFSHAEVRCKTAAGRHSCRLTRLQVAYYIKVTVICGDFTAPEFSSVKLHSIKLHTRSFPLPSARPFACSDPGLERVRACVDNTMRLCMMRMHLDSPLHQEGLGCTGDYMIESLISYTLYGETRLAAADILRTAYHLRQTGGFMFHTSYSLLYVNMVLDYLMYSGDFEIPREVFPQIECVLECFAGFTGKSGLVSEAPNYLFIDWVLDGESNYHHSSAARGMGCMTAFYISALNAGAKLADFLGFPEKSSGYRIRAAALAVAFRRELWDSEKGCFRDGIPHLTSVPSGSWLPADDNVVSYSVHTNALALACGIVPEPDRKTVLNRMMTDRTLIQPQPYFMHFVFEALRRCESSGDYMFELLKRWNIPVAEHPQSLKECWNCGDYCHAWGGTPAYQIVRSIFGVEILEPGAAAVRIAPEFGGLDFAEGAVPTVRGDLFFLWKNGELKLRIPRAIRYELKCGYPATVEVL